jgi:hypothetical protein
MVYMPGVRATTIFADLDKPATPLFFGGADRGSRRLPAAPQASFAKELTMKARKPKV